MIEIEEGDEEKSIVTPDLRLRFRWTGDRWTHTIALRVGPWKTVATAIEGSADDDLGVSRPTFQDLHLQRDGDEVVALTVGQSGPHH